MAEPPKLYGPCAPVIVLQTSNYCTRKPDNSGSLSGVLGKPHVNIMEDIAVLQHFIKTYYIRIKQRKSNKP